MRQRHSKRYNNRKSTSPFKILVLVALVFSVRAESAITTTNLGDGTTRLRADYVIPTANVVDVRDDICRGIGWTAQVTCTAERITAAQCTSGQLNTQITNPETCIQAIDRSVRTYLRDARRAGELKEVEDAQVAPVRAADKNGDLQ